MSSRTLGPDDKFHNSWGNLGSVLVVGSSTEQNDAHFRTPRRSIATMSPPPKISRQGSKIKLEDLEGRIIKEGYMYKLGHRFERWNKRYFVLTKDMLYYYKGDNRSYSSKGAIHMSQYSRVEEEPEEKKGKACLKMYNSTNINMRPMYFGLDDEDDLDRWMEKLDERLQTFKTVKSSTSSGRAKWFHNLYLRVAEARNLTTKDDASKGRSDCYCLIQLGEQCFRTQTAWKNITPFWGEEYSMVISDPNADVLSVCVFDEEPGGKDTPLGRIMLPAKGFQPGEATEQWFQLVPEDYKNFVSGDVKLSVEYLPGESGENGKITVNVLEARNLASKDSNGLSDPYVVVQFAGEKKKTEVEKKTLNPVYNKEFTYPVTPTQYDTLELKLTIWDWDMFGSHEFMGTITVPIKEFSPKLPVTRWYTLGGDSDRRGSLGSTMGDIRMKIKYTKQKVFPLIEYRQLLDMLFDTRMDLVRALVTITSERDMMAHTLVRIFEANMKTRQLLAFLCASEVDNSPDPDVLFRGNSVATKALDYFMKLIGLRYLDRTIGQNIKDIYESKKSCEIDPSKLEKGENLEKNTEYLINQVTEMFASIQKGLDEFPLELRDVFADLSLKVREKYGESHPARYTAISGFVFLRYFAASILGPKLFNLAKDHPGQMASRTLTLIAKVIQNLGNLVEFGQKEPYMAPLNVFIQDSIEPMKKYIDGVSKSASSGINMQTKSKGGINLEFEIATLHQLIKNDVDKILPHLSSKIAIPKEVRLRSLAWNSDQGWIACGGDNGMLKVLKLESQVSKDSKTRGLAAPSNLSMNQTLEGHNGAVMVVTWNDNYRKLTTSDENGLIIVWMLYKGMWYEEMINNRNKSVVKDMKWTSDGQKICIVYEDGAVIVGSVDGNRIWGKEISKVSLCQVEWSPDSGRHILFCTDQGEVHVYDSMGNFISKVPIFCKEDNERAEIIGVDWYDGSEGYIDPNAPSLAVGYASGKVQIMRSEQDEKPVLIDTGMKATKLKWNHAGSVLAVAGMLNNVSRDDKEANAVQFYTPFGQHMRTLKVPGSGINGLAWEGGGLRVALAVDSFIYFANIRPDYKWGYFGKTLVYAFTKPDRPEHCVVFWDTKTDERYVKYVKKLIGIRAAGDNCVLVTKADDTSEQYILILCNAIGTPVDSKYTEVEPSFMSMTRSHIICASEHYVYVWQYRTLLNDTKGVTGATSFLRKEGSEKFFHIDDVVTDTNKMETKKISHDPICAITASDKLLVIGRESGLIHRYLLPEIKLDGKYTLKCRPQSLALNNISSRLAIIDVNGVLTFLDLESKSKTTTKGQSGNQGAMLNFERKDVWDMQWADDNPELFAMMEKTRMYICRNLEVEEPIQSSGYICNFNNLKVKAVLLDEIMQTPEHPDNKEMVLRFETKSLRDTRDLLQTVGIKEASTFVEDNSHPRLWRLLAENALEKLDFLVAEKAFVRCQDYQGIQFVKKLKVLDNKMKQKAEVAAYFKRFDEAESIYRDIDRKDLAIELRMRLGDWFRVVQLLQSGGGDDALLNRAWNEIGDYYAERYKWAAALQYYVQAKNYAKLAECYYILEDFSGLEELIHQLPEGDPLLTSIGDKFTSVGISEHAVASYLKAGNIKSAIDCCVHLNKWDAGVDLAEHHDFRQIETLLSKYATHLLEKNKTLHAIELYRKASHHTEAAKLLFKLGKESGQKGNLLRAKKLYVLGALEVEQYRRKLLEQKQNSSGANKRDNKATLDGLLQEDSITGREKDLETSWRGAEAYHFFLLTQKQLYEGYIDASMKTALRLGEYEDILEPKEIYSLIALTAYFNKFYNQCSRAFMKLESLEDGAMYQNLALEIFTRHAPTDPTNKRKYECPDCGAETKDWMTACNECGVKFAPCIVSGRSILGNKSVQCKVCRHRAIEHEVRGVNFCPLCHHYAFRA